MAPVYLITYRLFSSLTGHNLWVITMGKEDTKPMEQKG